MFIITSQLKEITQKRIAILYTMSRQRRIQHNTTELKLDNSIVLTSDDVKQILTASCLTSLRAHANYSSTETVDKLLTLPLLKLHLEGYDLLPFLSYQSSLTSLTLDFCRVSSEALDTIIKSNPLREFTIFMSPILNILRTLSEKDTLISVKITDSDLAFGDVPSVEAVKLLCLNSSITKLNLADNKLTDEAAVILSQNTNLISLVLSRNNITSKGITALLTNTSIESLNISSCTNYTLNAPVPFDSNTTLQHLEISTPYPLSAMNVRALAANTTLTHLSANIDGEGCKILEMSNTSLISLYIIHPFGTSIYQHVEKNAKRKLNQAAMLMKFCLSVRYGYNR